jgi:diguanylate cyclase (GGDEF)-like protein
LRKTSETAQYIPEFRRNVLLPVTIVTILALGLAGFALYWTVLKSNVVSVERQLRTTERYVRAAVAELAQQQEMVAVWDDTVQKVSSPDLDLAWLDSNIGGWLYRTFGQDQVYIVDEAGRAIDATIDGQRVDSKAFDRVGPTLQGLLTHARQDTPPAPQEHKDAAIPYLTSGKAKYDAHLLELEGRPAAVSAMQIVPDTDGAAQPAQQFLLVSIRFLDGSFLSTLSQRNMIDSLRFSLSPATISGEVSVPVDSDEGKRIGYFVWRPELPGTAVMRVLGPTTLLVAILLISLMAILVVRLRRSMIAQNKTVLELRASEAQAHHLALHDSLTGLANRVLFEEKLSRSLSRASRGERSAVLVLDLDRFKNVNDTLGHQAGDGVVREFGLRLSSLVRHTDTVARLGGDEFAILLCDVASNADVESLCSRILDAVRRPFNVLGHQAFVGVSIGVALAPETSVDTGELMRKADIALYRAKAEGRDCFRYFTASMDETVKVRSEIEGELRAALKAERDLDVFYQPQISLDGRSIVGVEALLRWHHPTKGPISPDQFIPVAEETGLISQLGDWVIREACIASRRWPGLFVAINLSPLQFRAVGFAERVQEIVRQAGGNPHRLQLEVTEGILLDDNDLTQHAIKALRHAGFKIVLDDFGTGHSGLGYLQRFEVDKIKIDRSFVQQLGQDADATAIVRAVVDLGVALKLTVTAEGVETEAQKLFLSEAGCTEYQGFLFSRAVAADEIDGLLADQTVDVV